MSALYVLLKISSRRAQPLRKAIPTFGVKLDANFRLSQLADIEGFLLTGFREGVISREPCAAGEYRNVGTFTPGPRLIMRTLMILPALLAVILSQAALSQEHAIFKSVDRGMTWTKAGSNLAGNPRINSFGATINRIFAGTDAGIYSSSDEGRTWEKTSVTARTISFATLGNSIYAGTQSTGLLASKDQGMNWTPVISLASKNIRSLLAAQGRLYAGTDADGVIVSQDQGMTWLAQNAGLPPLSQIFAMAFIDNTIFAGLYNKGLYAWSDNEQRWTKAGNVKPLALAGAAGTLAVGHNPGGIYWSGNPKSSEWIKASGDFESAAPVWEMASGDKLVLAGMADGIFRSEDNGRTWSRTLKGLPAKGPGVSFLVRGDTIYAGLVISTK